MAKLQFLGATGTVTGAKFVLEANGNRAMIDCGLFQGFKELRERNWEQLPINPASIGWTLVTHAHIDHTGYLPRFVRDGFTGPVYATKATANLMKIMLPDSGRLQEEDAEYANRKGLSKHAPALPLYTERDAEVALKQLRPVDYNQPVRLSKFLSARFIPAGHILGSSFVEVEITRQDASPIKVLFSGDLGRYDEPILNDPAQVEEADYLLVESTYGNRLHDDKNPKAKLAEIINQTVERGGKIIIPAFAIGRTQLLVYYLRELEDEGLIPVLPVAVDSPMAAEATRLYVRHKDDHDFDMQELARNNRSALATRKFRLVSGRNSSKSLDREMGPAIIVSPAGMATGGRVLHHLARYLPDPASSIVLVGYQAAGTRGRRIQEGEKEIKIHGEMIPVRARVESIGGLSAHADSAEILKWLSGFKRPPRTTFMIHGEPDSAEALRDKIKSELGWNVVIPAYKEIIELG
ncbi:MAG TPA: MBL fold metallo-hydrolase [Blastocatellia bacterium]|nr:MBL fold metallo-hydrolase [Blastocatellia bacterium]